MRSMTGFGQSTGSNPRHAVSVTLRAVNHRYREVKLRLADEYRRSEAPLLELLEGEVVRGRVECVVDVQAVGDRDVEVEVHRPVVMAAHAALEELVEGGLIAEKLTAGDLLRLPEALEVRVAPDRWEDADHHLLLRVAGEALAQLVAARETEGAKLRGAIETRLAELASVAKDLAELVTEARQETLEALRRRVGELLEGSSAELDPGRLEQEVALLADKSDVSEELDRLRAHLEHARELLAEAEGENGGAVGKRLDFLSQEILRELNTTGAKCRDRAMARRVVEGKSVCEQLREQVQNVE